MSTILTGLAEEPLSFEAARIFSALFDWFDHQDVNVRMLCQACYRLGHPEPFVQPTVEADGGFALTCPHRRMVYRGPDPRMPAA